MRRFEIEFTNESGDRESMIATLDRCEGEWTLASGEWSLFITDKLEPTSEEVIEAVAYDMQNLAGECNEIEPDDSPITDLPIVEYCVCQEWLEQQGIASLDAAIAHLEDNGFDVRYARNGRSMYHGWNGAQFARKLRGLGTFATLTEAQAKIFDEALDLVEFTTEEATQ